MRVNGSMGSWDALLLAAASIACSTLPKRARCSCQLDSSWFAIADALAHAASTSPSPSHRRRGGTTPGLPSDVAHLVWESRTVLAHLILLRRQRIPATAPSRQRLSAQDRTAGHRGGRRRSRVPRRWCTAVRRVAARGDPWRRPTRGHAATEIAPPAPLRPHPSVASRRHISGPPRRTADPLSSASSLRFQP